MCDNIEETLLARCVIILKKHFWPCGDNIEETLLARCDNIEEILLARCVVILKKHLFSYICSTNIPIVAPLAWVAALFSDLMETNICKDEERLEETVLCNVQCRWNKYETESSVGGE